MDTSTADPQLLKSSLRFIRRVNAVLGYTRATISHLERFSRSWKKGYTIRMVDLATGSADVPRAILRWADRRGWDVRIVGVDLHPMTAHIASEESAEPPLTIVQADGLHAPFDDNSFDYALCSGFLHHLDEEQAVRVMWGMNRLGSR